MIGPTSEAYQPRHPDNKVVDELPVGKYVDWGYSIGYEQGPNGQAFPEGGNTAIFRIKPGGMTEPVYVTKPEDGASFKVSVIEGEGLLIRSRANGLVDAIDLWPSSRATIEMGDAYSYVNTHPEKDLVLHDVALPAFKDGDDVDLIASKIPKGPLTSSRAYSYCVVENQDGTDRAIKIASRFDYLVGLAMAGKLAEH